MPNFIGPIKPLEGVDRFNYSKIVDNAMERDLTPAQLTEELCGDHFRFNFGGLMIEGIDWLSYGVHTPQGLQLQRFEGEERAWLPMLAQLAFTAFMQNQQINFLDAQNDQLRELLALREERHALLDEIHASRAAIDKNAEDTANFLHGEPTDPNDLTNLFNKPPEGFAEGGDLTAREIDNMIFGKTPE